MAEDAAQEECLRHLRHPVAFGYRWLRDRARHHRELPDAAVPAERAGDRAADHGDLSALRPQRPADRDPRPRHAEARLLLPVAARQSPVRARSWRVRARLYGGVLKVRSGNDRARARRTWPRRLCRPHGSPRVGWPGPPTSSPISSSRKICHDRVSVISRRRVRSPLAIACRRFADFGAADRVRSQQLCAERADGRA